MYLFISWNVDRSWSCFTNEFIHKTNVSECAPRHHSIISSARAVRIEIFRRQARNEDRHCQEFGRFACVTFSIPIDVKLTLD